VGATVRVLTDGVVPVGAFVGGQLGAAIGGGQATVLVGAAGVLLLAFLWVVLSPVRTLRTLPEDRGGATIPIR
jgi:hypothetical protein